MRFFTSILLCTTLSVPALAQSSFDITPDKPYVNNGVEYGLAVRNEREMDLGDRGKFGRYEVTLYVSNKSGCTKIMMPRQTFLGTTDQDKLADFDCLNATGMRLTSKTGAVRARDFVVPYTSKTKDSNGKDITVTNRVKVGSVLGNGETVSNDLIFIIPQGETPRVRVRVMDLNEFQG